MQEEEDNTKLGVPVLTPTKLREPSFRKRASYKVVKKKMSTDVMKRAFQSQRHSSLNLDKEQPKDVEAVKYQMGFSHFKEKSQRLDQKLDLQKSLVNMVVHDLRCPTAQIKYSAQNLQLSLKSMRSSIMTLKSQFEQQNELLDRLEGGPPSPGYKLFSGPANDDLSQLISLVRSSLPLLPRHSSSLGQEFISSLEKLLQAKNKTPKQQRESSFFGTLNASMAASLEDQDSQFATAQRPASELDPEEANADIESTEDGIQTLIGKISEFERPKFIEEVSLRQSTFTDLSQCFERSKSVSIKPIQQILSEEKESKEDASSREPRVDQLVRETLYSQCHLLDQLSENLERFQTSTNSCESSSAILLNLINDLLDFAKAETGSFSFSNDFFDLKEEIKKAKSTLSFLASQKQIDTEVVFTKSPQADHLKSVFGDSGRLKQVIVNLMSNALKFTDEGGKVSVLVEIQEECFTDEKFDSVPPQGLSSLDIDKLKDKRISKHLVKIEVKDNGQGISEEGQSKLFKRFCTLTEHKQLNERGTGLGLCICKQIVEKMGGSIALQSKLNEGTTFSLLIPFLSSAMPVSETSSDQISEDEETEPQLQEPLKKSDNELKLPFFELQPKKMKSTIFRRSSFSAHLQGRMNGPDSPSSHVLSRSRSEFRKRLSFLSQTSRPLLSKAGLTNEGLSSICTTDDRWNHLRVLIVNDEPVSLMILEQMFREQLGTRVQTATNGQAAVDKTLDSYFDLVVMDLHMPVLDGFEATRQIRAGVLNKKSVIVALSASTFTEDLKKQCRDAGFSSWLTSPVVLKSLITDVLEKYLSDI